MCYGPDPGDLRLRKNVASWLTKFYQPVDPIPEERICITGGASQNLACLLQVYTDPVFTRNVWIVAPAYMLSFRIFDDAGFHKKLRAVPEDEEGIDIEFLRREIRKSEEKAKSDDNTQPVSRAKWNLIRQRNIVARQCQPVLLNYLQWQDVHDSPDKMIRSSSCLALGANSTNTSSTRFQPSVILLSRP